MQLPTFSICIPNYNYEHYIGETIRSVLSQSYTHFEIIIVDNASTDASVQVVKSFDDPRIRLYVNEYNVGFAPNLDRAASKAEMDFIIMLSSDDLMRPTALEKYAAVIQKLGDVAWHALLVSSIEIIDEKGEITGRMNRKNYYELTPAEELTAHLNNPYTEVFNGLKVFREVYPRMSVPGHFCSTAFSRQLYHRIGGYSSLNLLGPDAHLDYKALLKDALVVFHGEPLFAYRVHRQNQFSQNRNGASIRLPIDRYLFSIQYNDAELKRAGVDRLEMARFLIDDTCMKGAFHELRSGSWLQAFRYWMFAFASYPGLALCSVYTYLVALLLVPGPLSIYLARFIYRIFR